MSDVSVPLVITVSKESIAVRYATERLLERATGCSEEVIEMYRIPAFAYPALCHIDVLIVGIGKVRIDRINPLYYIPSGRKGVGLAEDLCLHAAERACRHFGFVGTASLSDSWELSHSTHCRLEGLGASELKRSISDTRKELLRGVEGHLADSIDIIK